MISLKKLVKSIKDFPEMLKLRPIVVDENMIVLWWNMRLKALKSVWIKETYYIKAKDLTEEQKKEFIIKDNVWFGEWDFDLLSNNFEIEDLTDWGLDVPWFDEDIDFDNINSNEDRENTKKVQNIICPKCSHPFTI